MNAFLDTEFNGFGGDLISMAIVADDGQEFYEVLPCLKPVQWVQDHVIPVLGKASPTTGPEATFIFGLRLASFLRKTGPGLHIIADWPEDFIFLFRALISGPGRVFQTPNFSTQIVFNLPATDRFSETPHNALADARALQKLYYEFFSGPPQPRC
jgi:hypothetical protein